VRRPSREEHAQGKSLDCVHASMERGRNRKRFADFVADFPVRLSGFGA
jgi:hypothetical protein